MGIGVTGGHLTDPKITQQKIVFLFQEKKNLFQELFS
jgi:hypothetical protein